MAKRFVATTKRDLGFYMRVYRAERDLSQVQLAGLLGIKPSHVSLLESGRRAPGRDLAKSLVELIGISWEIALAEPKDAK